MSSYNSSKQNRGIPFALDILLLFCGALSLRLVLVFFLQYTDWWGDAVYNVSIAEALANGGKYYPTEKDAFFVYSALLHYLGAFSIFLFKENMTSRTAVVVILVVATSFVAPAFYAIFTLIDRPRREGLVAGGVAIFHPIFLAHSVMTVLKDLCNS